MALLTFRQHKINKSNQAGSQYLTCIMHLAPANLSGFEVCPYSSVGCRASCLNTSGRGNCTSVQSARIRRTKLLFQHAQQFKSQLVDELTKFVARCKKLGLKPAVRLNGTSDIEWEIVFPELFTMFPHVQFYDYTKNYSRVLRAPQNYYLLYSRSENTPKWVVDNMIKLGYNVAIVFSSIPLQWEGHKVYSGDETDLRFLDPQGVIIGLSAKGRAKMDKSGFVVRV